MNNRSQLIIAFEGMDGAGKTTVSKEIVRMLKSVYSVNYSPIDTYNHLTQRETNRASLSFGYFLDNILSSTSENNADILIYDRHFLSALGYYLLRTNREPTRNNILSLQSKYQTADVTFILSANKKTREQRIFNKKYIDSYDLNSLNQYNIDYWVLFYSQANDDNIYYIDTNKKFSDVINEIDTILEFYRTKPNKKIQRTAKSVMPFACAKALPLFAAR